MTLCKTPEPPYFAVIFSSVRSEEDAAGYAGMAATLERLAADQPGFLGIDTARDQSGLGMTVSYWRDEASIAAWKAVAIHHEAQREGRARWYLDYVLRVAKVERAYDRASSRF